MLRIRLDTHDQYTVPRINYPDWVLSRYAWRGDERVLDVGSGPGVYYEALCERCPQADYMGLDLSFGILAQHPVPNRLVTADALHLPFANQHFDVVMANHMLFHVSDVEDAIVEIQRVLHPDGVLMAATNSAQTMPEFYTLFRRALMLLSAHGKLHSQPPPMPHSSFTLEGGVRKLSRHFYAVVRHDISSAFVFDTVEPVMNYIESWRDLREPQLPDDVHWDDVMDVMREQIARVIAHMGELVVNKISGVLIASNRGGFIHDFVEARHKTV